MHVHKIAEELEMYANDVQLALNCEARGMDLVRATSILLPLHMRLRVIFLRMHRRLRGPNRLTRRPKMDQNSPSGLRSIDENGP